MEYYLTRKAYHHYRKDTRGREPLHEQADWCTEPNGMLDGAKQTQRKLYRQKGTLQGFEL